ncbi:MAG: nucleoside kinase [Treponema sp.]|nr:nucleoside kinase [Treponema sp.]
MRTISVTFPDGKNISVDSGTTAITLLSHFSEDPSNILAVLANNEVFSLTTAISYDVELKPILRSSKIGASIYRRSLCFVLATAAHNLYPDKRLLVGHSLGYGYYYTFDDGKKISDKEIQSLKDEMNAIIQANHQIITSQITYKKAKELFESLGLVETRKQLDCICPPYIKINTLTNFSDMYFGSLVPSTGYLKVFDIIPYGQGFLLRFPTSSRPDSLPEFHDIPALYTTYERYKKWGKQIGVRSAADINELIKTRKIKEFIDICETFQVKCIADIADKIRDKGNVKLVLMAGPSSSGKTTSSKKLELQLKALGYRPHVISLDNYYVGRERNPIGPDGKPDYECLEALDVPLLNQNLLDLFAGKEVELPCYDFHTGERYYNNNKLALEPQDIIIMEGIHGLNDKLTPLVKPEYKFKIYLSALTQLNLDDHNRISTSDNRLIRRIVRDFNFRGMSAARTISMWENVRKGERLHIFPFQDNADVMLNTALDYELPVLKVFAEPLLRCISPLQSEYTEASRLLRFLSNFSPIPPTAVPDRSIIREFIGGSAFHY